MQIRGGVGNRIGGPAESDRNIVSGNAAQGIDIGWGATDNLVQGNYIGLDATGRILIQNGLDGVAIETGGQHNTIRANTVAGGTRSTVLLADSGTAYNSIVGNLVNLDASGTRTMPIAASAIMVTGVGINRIGGPTPAERNVISGPVILCRGCDPGTALLGNYLGTDITGTVPAPPQANGVQLGTGAPRVFLGGLGPGEGNVLGLQTAAGATYPVVLGNRVGIGEDGMAIPDAGGIIIRDTPHAFVEANTITNSYDGVTVENSPGTTLRRNSIWHNTAAAIRINDTPAVSPPTILTAGSAAVGGTACPGCEIEIFSDSEDEGQTFEGWTAADAAGAFSLTFSRPLAGPAVTATATDAVGNTSVFSAPRRLPGR